ncbi:hypothetical protein AAHH78_41760, partial [Burkholderia pseudomallei]
MGYRSDAGRLQVQTGLPVVVPCRDGGGVVVEALLAYRLSLDAVRAAGAAVECGPRSGGGCSR